MTFQTPQHSRFGDAEPTRHYPAPPAAAVQLHDPLLQAVRDSRPSTVQNGSSTSCKCPTRTVDRLQSLPSVTPSEVGRSSAEDYQEHLVHLVSEMMLYRSLNYPVGAILASTSVVCLE